VNNPRHQPVPNPRRFIGSVFNLGYGAQDGSEPLSTAEIKAQLRDSGIDPDAAWKEFSTLLQPQIQKESLAAARKARLAAPPPASVPQGHRTRASLLDEMKQLIAALSSQDIGVFGRKWEESSDEDLAAVCNQLRRQIERNKADERRR
jgi:hypothetical protein